MRGLRGPGIEFVYHTMLSEPWVMVSRYVQVGEHGCWTCCT